MNLKFLEVINYEGGNDVLVWKHPCEDFNTGSHLIVHESQEALFMCNGQVLDVFGPGRHDLKTENIPLLRRLLNIPTGGISPFHCEVYYVNKSIPMDLKWGTPDQVIAMDPQFRMLIHAGANGGMGVQIGDSKRFLVSFNGTNRAFTTEALVSYFREMIVTRVKSQLTVMLGQVGFTSINAHLNEISAAMQERLGEEMAEFGVKLVKFFVSGIRLADEDYNKIQNILTDATSMDIMSAAEGRRSKTLSAAETEAQRFRMDMLGYNWQDEQLAKVAEEYAKNPNSANNIGSMAAQIPLGFGMGQMLRGTTQPLLDQAFSQPPKAFGQQNAPVAPASPFGTNTSPFTAPSAPLKTKAAEPIQTAPVADTVAQEDPVAVLQKLKTMLDAGLIPQDVYDKKMQEVLSRM